MKNAIKILLLIICCIFTGHLIIKIEPVLYSDTFYRCIAVWIMGYITAILTQED